MIFSHIAGAYFYLNVNVFKSAFNIDIRVLPNLKKGFNKSLFYFKVISNYNQKH